MHSELKSRREAAAKLLGKSSALILFSGVEKKRTADLVYPFDADRDFYYLTGIEEHSVILVIYKSEEDAVSEMLFVPRFSPLDELLFGRTKTEEYYREISGIQNVQFAENLMQGIYRLKRTGLETVCFCGEGPIHSNEIPPETALLRELRQSWPALKAESVTEAIHNMRRIKSPSEVERVKKAVELTGKGINAVLRALAPGKYEYQMQAEFEYAMKMGGARQHGFDPIFAGGKNSFALHYTQNRDELKDGDLMLIDLGADYEHYSADISRTFPVNGRFTEKQAYWYNVCLKAQELVMAEMGPGKNINASGKRAVEYVTEELIRAGYIADASQLRNYSANNYATVGRADHYVGLDTHDVGSYAGEFMPGMIFAVEPGIYIKDENIGIRIEDDVLITESGIEILSRNIPKTIEEIEAAMKG